MEGCVFCRILDGDLPAEIVLDEGPVVGFLDHRPLFPGHVLVVPRGHHETLADLPAELVEPLFAQVQRLSRIVPEVLGATGAFVANNNIVSQSVPHLHVHVVPRRFKDGLRGFFWPRVDYDDDDHRREVADRLREAIG
ncbi:MAG: HIT family protein [Actinomycetota bacterium]